MRNKITNMLKSFLPLALCLSLIVLDSKGLQSQTNSDINFTVNEKVAIVRLYMNGPKITYLTKQMTNSELSVKDRQAIKEQLDLHLLDRKIYSQNIISDFENYFSVSQTYFVPDNLWSEFLEEKNRQGPYFLNKNGEIDSSIQLPSNKAYYVIGRVNDDYDFQIYDEEGFKVPPPYPSTTKHSLLSKLKSVFGDGGKIGVTRFNDKILNWERKNTIKTK
jgi:hypothetical protein